MGASMARRTPRAEIIDETIKAVGASGPSNISDATYNNQTGSNAYMDVSVTVANPTLTNPVPATTTQVSWT